MRKGKKRLNVQMNKHLSWFMVPCILLMLFCSIYLLSCSSSNKNSSPAPPQRIPVGKCTPPPQGEGWINLFSDENKPYWENVSSNNKKEGFEFTPNNELHIFGTKQGGYIAFLGRKVKDFDLHIEFKLTPKANSGVFFRSDLKDPVQGGFEIQVLEDYGSPPGKHNCGALYDVATPMFNMSFPPGEWNSYDISCRGSHLTVIMNGWKVLDVDLSLMTMPIGKFNTPLAQLPQEGYLQLQDHGGEVWYRNAYLKVYE